VLQAGLVGHAVRSDRRKAKLLSPPSSDIARLRDVEGSPPSRSKKQIGAACQIQAGLRGRGDRVATSCHHRQRAAAACVMQAALRRRIAHLQVWIKGRQLHAMERTVRGYIRALEPHASHQALPQHRQEQQQRSLAEIRQIQAAIRGHHTRLERNTAAALSSKLAHLQSEVSRMRRVYLVDDPEAAQCRVSENDHALAEACKWMEEAGITTFHRFPDDRLSE